MILTSDDKNKLLNEYLNCVEELKDSIKGVSNEILIYRPFDDAWSIKEHFIHCVDAEVSAYLRLRLVIAEEGFPIRTFNEDKWTNSIDHHSESLEDYSNLFSLLRKIEHNFIKKNSQF